ncbi:tRNA lysidine(34) synthetase TilS [Afifella pfennigii]|uniref:tRNA lysidine(34) synthetase TilS n=1 Tax=Afifella pfennigii TaxID=209897 RepID=UPI000AB41F57|nr:tRNA lysidine(34) synthetase TilS [Afifella pfennigii]
MSPAKPSAPAAEAALDERQAEALLAVWLAKGALIAVSGGPDSMALLGLSARLAAKRGGRKPEAFTFDHGLREESGAEAAAVARACGELGLKHHVRRWPAAVRPRSGLQAAARLARYAAAIGVAKEAGLGAVLTAHHRDDVAETVLMRLARSSEPRALAGIEPSLLREGWPQIGRPFLGVARAELATTCAALGLPKVEDPSNRDPAFERARIRAAMPALAAIGIDAARLVDFANRQRTIAAAFEAEAEGALAEAEVSETGVIHLPRPGGWRNRLGEEAWLAAVRRLVIAAAGATSAPTRDKLAALDAALGAAMAGEGAARHTLHGAQISLAAEGLSLWREWGREGPAPLAADSGAPIIFDGRYIVAPHPRAASGTRLAGFGVTGRGGEAERSLPALFAGETCLAVPPCLAAKAPQGCRSDLEATPIIAARLKDRHLGGLYDRLMVENRLPGAAGRAALAKA